MARTVAALVVAVVALTLPAAAAPAARRSPEPRGTVLAAARFQGLSASDRAWIDSVVAAAPRTARDALRKVAPYLTIQRGAIEDAAGGNSASIELGAGAAPRFVVAYGPFTLLRGGYGAHMVLHELGHVVDNALLDDDERDALTGAWLTAPAWVDCYPQPTGSSSRCVPWTEIFAEQFAFYGTGDLDMRTTYNVPPLLGRDRFGALLAVVTAGAVAV